ncbi:MAG: Zn-ribbon domain-containing OB-fold protein, partial [Candidatus Hodarchaeales archaeon]
CSSCGEIIFPKRKICPSCCDMLEKEITLSGKGVLQNYTVVRVPPDGMELQIPYIMGIVKLDEGPSIVTEITGIDPEKDDLEIGTKLRLAFRKYGSESRDSVIIYGYKFIPDKYPVLNT